MDWPLVVKGGLVNRRERKKTIIGLLEKGDWGGLESLRNEISARDFVDPLISALCSPPELVRYRAAEMLGVVVSQIAELEAEAARVIMRRFLWSLNDESGGIGWGAPEAMAEIMVRSSLLRDEYLHMLISYMREDGEEIWQDGNYLELPMLQRGLLWGIGRLCDEYPDLMRSKHVVNDLAQYLTSEDKTVVGYALYCLQLLRAVELAPEIVALLGEDHATFRLYRDGKFQTVKISELARNLESAARREE